MNRFHFIGASVLALSSAAFAGRVANQVINYTPGTISAALQNSNSALGLPAGDTSFGALTPFNPPFLGSQIMGIGAGGSLTLKLDNPVSVIPTARIGVFSNVGIIDDDPTTTFDPNTFETLTGGRGIAGNPLGTFSPAGFGTVSVSSNGSDFTQIGAGTISFGNPTNAYLDTDINLNFASPGTLAADFFKPFAGDLSSFNGLRYRDASASNDMVRTLNGSAGGTWIDISGVGLTEVNYVKFDVPTGGRIILDSVVAIPEPASLGLIGVAALLLKRRR